jgi:hypothetical protein
MRGRAGGVLYTRYKQSGGSWDSGEESRGLTIGCQSDVGG